MHQDGRTNGIMAPSDDAQAACSGAHAQSRRRRSASVGYMEAHGTGTPVGDPTEVRASPVFGGRRPADPCLIGSVKSNIGHLEGGAGIAGLIKAALALQHEAIPPTATPKTPTPEVDWANSGLRVVTEGEP